MRLKPTNALYSIGCEGENHRSIWLTTCKRWIDSRHPRATHLPARQLTRIALVEDQAEDNSMSSPLQNSAKRVQDFLTERGFAFVVMELPGSTRTAQEAADSIGCTVSQIAKSLVFREKKTDQALLVIASGSNRVDLRKIEAATGLALGKADGAFVREKTGFAIGGVPPVGHSEPLQTILDPDLKHHAVIWAAAGTPFAVFQLRPDDLVPLTGGRWVAIAE